MYKVNIKTKQETVLYSFTGDPDSGEPVYGNLLMDKSGNLYGTTQGGGSDIGGADQSLVMDAKGSLYGTTERGGLGEGVVFKVNIKTKTETVLFTFTGSTDGEIPSSGLVRDRKGNLYGTTMSSANGDGTVFEVTGTKETVLHRFHGKDGQNPFRSPLLLDDIRTRHEMLRAIVLRADL